MWLGQDLVEIDLFKECQEQAISVSPFFNLYDSKISPKSTPVRSLG